MLFCVAVFKRQCFVGHVHSSTVMRDAKKTFAKVMGEMMNREAGYGLKVLCVSHLYGPKTYIDKIKELVNPFFLLTAIMLIFA